ncbi:hypothetical protein [Acidaminococcus fermentans]|uniref:hypothetical protein n=1 Tax=Acidaminococcus fermentans TaxID=905 RepID=UPI003F8C0D82
MNVSKHGGLKRLIGLCICAALWCSWWVPTGLAASRDAETIQVRVSDWQKLKSNLSRLSEINDNLQSESQQLRKQLAESQQSLTEAQSQLNEARKQSMQLQLALTESRALSQSQEQSLGNVNKSLKAMAAEEKRTRLRIKAQRNTWEAVAAGLLLAWAAK